MKKNNKIFLSIILTLVLMVSTFSYVGADGTIQVPIQTQSAIDNLEVTVPVDANGNADLYVTIHADENGVIKQVAINSSLVSSDNSKVESIEVTESDIVLTFHVSLTNWTGQYADVSWNADSNQPNITDVRGSVFVKSTSILYPETYFSEYFEMNNIGGQIHAGDYLGYADLGDETAVRVSFGSVVITTIQMVAPMPNTSQVVYK